MKIVCDSCSAKYSIADEKVAGKVFKIRCKKCSAVIVVRGDQLGQDAAAEADMGDPNAIWHVVVNGDQQGPFAPHQIGEMLTAGTIDWEAYIWREGFEEWMAARDVPELVEAVTGQPQDGQHYSSAPPAESDPAPAIGADPFGAADPFAQPAAAADPFGAPAAQASPFAATAQADGGMFGQAQEARAHAEAGGDLFAQAGASPFDGGGDDDVVVSAASPRVSEEQASMTGQRNENSVLFSLQNLQALATGSSAGGTSSPPASFSQPGMASGEGSGLIDIRALASAAATPMGAGASSQRSNVDDLISIGTGSPLGGSLGAPVLAPVQEEKSNKGLIIGIAAAAGVIALAAIAVIAILLMKQPDPVAQADTAGGAITPGAQAVNGNTNQGVGTPEVAGIEENGTNNVENAGGTEPEAGGTDMGDTNAAGTPLTARERRDRDRARAAAVAAMTDSPSAAMDTRSDPTPSMTAQSPRNSDLDSLLDSALMGGGTPTAMAATMDAPAASSLPDTPSRDQVSRALRSVSGAVSRCGGGQHGSAIVQVNVSGSSGRVTNAQVTSGPFAGTPAGSCIARAVRGARFPQFSRPSFSVSFPYSL